MLGKKENPILSITTKAQRTQRKEQRVGELSQVRTLSQIFRLCRENIGERSLLFIS
jgi:hypothetical protein